MKKSVFYEIIAATLMMFGAVLLAFTFYPIINPAQYRIDYDQEASIWRYILGMPVSLLVLLGAWSFNRKARKVRPDKQKHNPPAGR
jgi:ABC-type nickel/cobalt efflux system permease component RcnA